MCLPLVSLTHSPPWKEYVCVYERERVCVCMGERVCVCMRERVCVRMRECGTTSLSTMGWL